MVMLAENEVPDQRVIIDLAAEIVGADQLEIGRGHLRRPPRLADADDALARFQFDDRRLPPGGQAALYSVGLVIRKGEFQRDQPDVLDGR